MNHTTEEQCLANLWMNGSHAQLTGGNVRMGANGKGGKQQQ
jgi:hypothetical protein